MRLRRRGMDPSEIATVPGQAAAGTRVQSGRGKGPERSEGSSAGTLKAHVCVARSLQAICGGRRRIVAETLDRASHGQLTQSLCVGMLHRQRFLQPEKPKASSALALEAIDRHQRGLLALTLLERNGGGTCHSSNRCRSPDVGACNASRAICCCAYVSAQPTCVKAGCATWVTSEEHVVDEGGGCRPKGVSTPRWGRSSWRERERGREQSSSDDWRCSNTPSPVSQRAVVRTAQTSLFRWERSRRTGRHETVRGVVERNERSLPWVSRSCSVSLDHIGFFAPPCRALPDDFCSTLGQMHPCAILFTIPSSCP